MEESHGTIVLEIPNDAQQEDPLSREEPAEAPEKTIAKCTGDCRNCIVQAVVRRMDEKHGMGRAEAIELQRRFNFQAFGYKNVGDKYTRPLYHQERSLEQMADRVAGCDKISNGSRLLTHALLEHSQHTLEMKIDLERAQYISPLVDKAVAAPAQEEKKYVPPAPAPTGLQNLLRSLGTFAS